MTARIRVGRIIYFILASLFALCTMAQFFFAGSAIFMDPVEWRKHVTFVHLFGFNIPIFMLAIRLYRQFTAHCILANPRNHDRDFLYVFHREF